MLWPSSVRCVCPGNRHLRLRSNSNAEYGLLIVLVAIALVVFSINTRGGLLTQFNRLIASPSGVEQIYNQSGATHLITAHITGVRAGDRTKVKGSFLIIQTHGQGFIVRSGDGQMYKAGASGDCQMITERITATVGAAAITNIESLMLEDDELSEKLAPLMRSKALNFVSGEISVDDLDGIALTSDPYQFPFMRKTETAIKLEAAPLKYVIEKMGDQFATGQLSIRSITTNGKTATNASS